MALSSSSVLHWWSARYGEIPPFGGYPVFSRSTAAKVVDRSGKLITALPLSPRFGWDTISSERRQTLLLEHARTNGILYSSAFTNGVWTKSSVTAVDGVADPAGGTAASTLTATATDGVVQQDLSAGSSMVRTNSVWIRMRTGVGQVGLLDPLGAAWVVQAVTANWQRFSVTGAAGTGRAFRIRIYISGNAIDVYAPQQDDSPYPTSEIATTSAAASRSADSLYWEHTPAPQAMMLYMRFIEKGTIAALGRAIAIGNSVTASPFFTIDGGTGVYRANNNGAVVSSAPAAPAIGDTVELVAILAASGAVTLIQSINGAAVTAGSTSGASALASAWSDTKLWLNSTGSATVGAGRYAEVKVVKYADVAASSNQGIMDELRAFEFDGQGNQL